MNVRKKNSRERPDDARRAGRAFRAPRPPCGPAALERVVQRDREGEVFVLHAGAVGPLLGFAGIVFPLGKVALVERGLLPVDAEGDGRALGDVPVERDARGVDVSVVVERTVRVLFGGDVVVAVAALPARRPGGVDGEAERIGELPRAAEADVAEEGAPAKT